MQQVLRGLAIGLFLLILNGCDESANVSNTSQASFSAVSTTADQTNNSSESIIATIGDKSLTQADIDQSIQLKLYDLEWAKYELRKESLATQIKNNLNPSTDHPKAISTQVPIIQKPSTFHSGHPHHHDCWSILTDSQQRGQ